MRVITAAAACTFAVGAAVATASPAVAQPQTAYAEVKNVVQTGADPDEAIVTVKYRCSGAGLHLWTSVKQGPDLKPGQTTSDYADAWYETPEGPAPNCDGKNRVERYTVSRVEGFDQLHSGEGYVQFVIFYLDESGEFQRIAWEDPGAFYRVR